MRQRRGEKNNLHLERVWREDDGSVSFVVAAAVAAAAVAAALVFVSGFPMEGTLGVDVPNVFTLSNNNTQVNKVFVRKSAKSHPSQLFVVRKERASQRGTHGQVDHWT